MAKGRVPTRDELLAFIKESATPMGKREIARAFGLKGDQRIELKQLLRDLRDTGDIAADRAKTFKDPKALTDITVLEIVRVDDDGHLLAVPRDLKPDELTLDQAVSLLAERAAKAPAKKPKATRAKKAAPVPANDAGETPPGTPKATKKKAAPKRKAAKKADAPPRTGTDG